ncbi:putative ATP-grasp-modified RiPP [Allokutzneria sp. A3M-2-11 16]|uniref:putative ATP-grasp-modified RiPP n=1 Tax=Allokutzneria sp. A3M-2-11 16 TaxID=2962043 RepID=UPI0020B7144B|nr:putative ATP-grasp-modified RiPP [Allokutzneria sp. A3M-2-11 16]MCP3802285.1 putative ATP-grasp-modified RiPP [Allokutzneria sp. A3M-2-11 16]
MINTMKIGATADNPLSSTAMRLTDDAVAATAPPSGPTPRPFALRWLRPAQRPAIPDYRYSAELQVAVSPNGTPLAPQLDKDWTTSPYKKDGDGPNCDGNEDWGWEEV